MPHEDRWDTRVRMWASIKRGKDTAIAMLISPFPPPGEKLVLRNDIQSFGIDHIYYVDHFFFK